MNARTGTDHELEVLLSPDGSEFQFVQGYRVKIAARHVGVTRPPRMGSGTA